jgi:hypothetical protein
MRCLGFAPAPGIYPNKFGMRLIGTPTYQMHPIGSIHSATCRGRLGTAALGGFPRDPRDWAFPQNRCGISLLIGQGFQRTIEVCSTVLSQGAGPRGPPRLSGHTCLRGTMPGTWVPCGFTHRVIAAKHTDRLWKKENAATCVSPLWFLICHFSFWHFSFTLLAWYIT